MKNRIVNNIAAVFTYADTVPEFKKFMQLAASGINQVFILLDADEYVKAFNEKYEIFCINLFNTEEDSKLTLAEWYATISDVNITLLNSGDNKTEEEKLSFYQSQLTNEFLINLFICKDIQYSSNKIHKELFIRITRVRLFFHYTYEYPTLSNLANVNKSKFSTEAVNLLELPINPIICYNAQWSDLTNSQWLFKIFSELLVFEINKSSTQYSAQLNALISEYQHIYLQYVTAEKRFYSIHRKMYAPGSLTPATSFWIQYQYNSIKNKRDMLEERMTGIINDLITLYDTLKSSNQVKHQPSR